MDYVLTPDETQVYQYETLSMVELPEPATSDKAPRNAESLAPMCEHEETPTPAVVRSVSPPKGAMMNPDEFPEGGREAWTTVLGR